MDTKRANMNISFFNAINNFVLVFMMQFTKF